jgi:RecA-family ATPase
VTNAAPQRDALPVVRAADIAEAAAAPRWLVDSLWARAGVGILGGAPKCCKSWLALEIAVAVTSGQRCLHRFAVGDSGPALLYMAEDAAPVVKARLCGICRHRGLDLNKLDIHLITAAALRLDRAQDQSRLRDAVACYKPRLLVLDPFVRLHRIDENDAGQVSALLGYLRELQRELDVAIMVVHHARKNGSASQPGHSLRGSGDFFAWADSLLYVRRQRAARTTCASQGHAALRGGSGGRAVSLPKRLHGISVGTAARKASRQAFIKRCVATLGSRPGANSESSP